MAKKRGRKPAIREVSETMVLEGTHIESKSEEKKGESWASRTEHEEEMQGKEGEPNKNEAEKGEERVPTEMALKQNEVGKEKKSWRGLFVNNRNGECGLKLERLITEEDEIQVTIEEMEPETQYWQHSLFAFILGQEIPLTTMVNFLRVRWKGLVMPKVVKYDKGFILRFETKNDMEEVSRRGIQFFYSKPLILQPWRGDGERYDDITSIPIWIQLPKLPVGLWGARTLSKIASKVRAPVHTDEMTTQKMRIEYARLLVKVEMGQELPKEIKIRLEGKDEVLLQPVRYEWLPCKCQHCGRWGHREEDCKIQGLQKWVRKENENDEGTKGAEEEKQKEGDNIKSISREEITPQSKGKGKEAEWQEASRGKQKKGQSWVEKTKSVEVHHALSNLFQVLSNVGGMVEGNVIAGNFSPHI